MNARDSLPGLLLVLLSCVPCAAVAAGPPAGSAKLRDRGEQHVERTGGRLRITVDASLGTVRPSGLEGESADPLHLDRRVSVPFRGWMAHRVP